MHHSGKMDREIQVLKKVFDLHDPGIDARFVVGFLPQDFGPEVK